MPLENGGLWLLKKIRSCLRKKGATAVIVAHEDEWQSEVLPENKERLAYLTGFTGSAGLAFVSLKKAVLFVDSRYTLQAKKQTDFDVLEVPTQTIFSKWLFENLKKGDKVLYDAWCHTVAQIKRLSSVFEKKQASLIAYSNLVDDVWENKPAEKEVHIFDYPLSLAGKTTKEKIDLVKKTFFAENFDAFVVCNPDTVSWLLNKRSDAVLYSPLYLKRIVVWKSGKITDFDDVNQKDFKNKIIAIDDYQTPMQIKVLLEKMGAKVCHADNPFLPVQAIKNSAEIKGMKQAAVNDSVAICRYLAWLQEHYKKCTEYLATDTLEKYRQEFKSYCGNSFETISAKGKNAALPHYIPSKEKSDLLTSGGVYLLDTGGQYLGGTTDMTRTIFLGKGKISPILKKRYTQVLQGHIDLAMASFPPDTTGAQLDVLAKKYLWMDGADFAHGTGHGIGCFSNVHETPPSISPYAKSVLKAGMILSNEPAYYLEGRFGIRIENMLLVNEKNKDGFLSFDTISYVPFCAELIDEKLLTSSQKNWIVLYYRKIMSKIYPKLDDKSKKWLKGQVEKWLV